MEFCPMCNFMVYTKLNKDSDTPTLSHYCKNCGWENVIIVLMYSIYLHFFHLIWLFCPFVLYTSYIHPSFSDFNL